MTLKIWVWMKKFMSVNKEDEYEEIYTKSKRKCKWRDLSSIDI